MPEYHYKARTASGQVIQGYLKALSEEVARRALESQWLVFVELRNTAEDAADGWEVVPTSEPAEAPPPPEPVAEAPSMPVLKVWTPPPRERRLAVLPEAAVEEPPTLALSRVREPSVDIPKPRPRKLPAPLARLLRGKGRLPAQDRMLFLGHLGHMLSAGLSITRSLDALAEQTDSGRTQEVIEKVGSLVRSGKALSTAMATAETNAFSLLEVGIVRAGEVGGMLPEALRRLLSHQERDMKIERQVKASLLYPTVVMGCAFALVIFLAQYLVAGIAPILHNAKVPMPLLTRIVVGGVEMMRQPGPLLLTMSVLGGLAWGLRRWARSEGGRVAVEEVLLRMPVVGDVLTTVETQRVCEGIGVMYACGVPILNTLQQVEGTCAFARTRRAVAAVGAAIKDGATMAEAMKRTELFPRVVIHMVAVGEESGKLADILEKLAEYQEVQIRAALERFAAAIEPISIVMMGVLVAAIILIVFAPLYQMIGTLA